MDEELWNRWFRDAAIGLAVKYSEEEVESTRLERDKAWSVNPSISEQVLIEKLAVSAKIINEGWQDAARYRKFVDYLFSDRVDMDDAFMLATDKASMDAVIDSMRGDLT